MAGSHISFSRQEESAKLIFLNVSIGVHTIFISHSLIFKKREKKVLAFPYYQCSFGEKIQICLGKTQNMYKIKSVLLSKASKVQWKFVPAKFPELLCFSYASFLVPLIYIKLFTTQDPCTCCSFYLDSKLLVPGFPIINSFSSLILTSGTSISGKSSMFRYLI